MRPQTCSCIYVPIDCNGGAAAVQCHTCGTITRCTPGNNRACSLSSRVCGCVPLFSMEGSPPLQHVNVPLKEIYFKIQHDTPGAL
ncbi:hypothetical protein GDO81_012729 [Engystomops pustulosus]|uniref:Uncharacterized protein n=1 Tax=Engystomops pustulosus TaxID=76066 RepID=A0AAV7B1V1_ENGPU|nr:hypothetical protein GDO81_012729 [Engystomops pustulosus]